MADYCCSVNGVVVDPQLLHQRLVGLTGTGQFHAFTVHTRVYSAGIEVGKGNNATTPHLRLARSVSDDNLSKWQLYQLGNAEPLGKYSCNVRPVIQSTLLTADPFPFLESIGLKFAWEYLQQGNAYLISDQLSVTISQLYQIQDRGNLESADPIQEEWLVEVKSVSTSQDLIPEVSKTLSNFMSLLEG